MIDSHFRVLVAALFATAIMALVASVAFSSETRPNTREVAQELVRGDSDAKTTNLPAMPSEYVGVSDEESAD